LLASEPLAVKTRNRHLGYIRNVFGLETVNGFNDPHARARQVQILTPEQLTNFLNAVDRYFVLFFALSAFSGLRREEIVSVLLTPSGSGTICEELRVEEDESTEARARRKRRSRDRIGVSRARDYPKIVYDRYKAHLRDRPQTNASTSEIAVARRCSMAREGGSGTDTEQ
jgi:hypothetical protein